MQLSNNKGLVLFVTFVFLMLISMGVVLVLLGVSKYTSFSEGQIQRLRAITLAEAGIHWAYWKFRDDPTFFSTDPTIVNITPETGGPNVQITVTGPVSGRYTIKSKVVY